MSVSDDFGLSRRGTWGCTAPNPLTPSHTSARPDQVPALPGGDELVAHCPAARGPWEPEEDALSPGSPPAAPGLPRGDTVALCPTGLASSSSHGPVFCPCELFPAHEALAVCGAQHPCPERCAPLPNTRPPPFTASAQRHRCEAGAARRGQRALRALPALRPLPRVPLSALSTLKHGTSSADFACTVPRPECRPHEGAPGPCRAH